ncbi:hypothetical protein TrVGV298_001536 [Trichoderma virens]|nr:hypothetical protein TrVGV298_001536 [Trichoderma virens]
MGCVHGHPSDTPAEEEADSGRYNHSNFANFEHDALDYPMAQGTFRWVAKGKYTSGPRKNQACVTKWFKSGAVFSEEYFTHDILAVDKALEIVNRFNRCASNTGWNDESTAWGEVMQAVSHFSYHVSGGMYVLCDLQGGIYQREVVLSDPVILSRRRAYGVTDLGPEGISSFFSSHDCNRYCRSNWTRPANPAQVFRPTPRTTMMRRNVPTAQSRPLHTMFEAFEDFEDDDDW